MAIAASVAENLGPRLVRRVPGALVIAQTGNILPVWAAIDFETASNARDSACAVGIVRVEGEKVVSKQSWLIQPPAGTQFVHTPIHGIGWKDVRHAPTFPDVWREACCLIVGVESPAAPPQPPRRPPRPRQPAVRAMPTAVPLATLAAPAAVASAVCRACWGTDFWESRWGDRICSRCHPRVG